MIHAIKSREDLETVISYIQRYKLLMDKYKALMDLHREMAVRYLEVKNLKSVVAEDGARWQKRQNTSVQYQMDKLRRLMRHHRVDPSTVIKTRTVEEVDEEALTKLLKAGVITVEEFEDIAIRHTGKPFIVRLPNAKRKSKAPISIRSRRQDYDQHRNDGASRGTKFRKIGLRRGNKDSA